MKYYVSYKQYDGENVHITVTGGRYKNYKYKEMRHCVNFIDGELPEGYTSPLFSNEEVIEQLFKNPMKKMEAKRFFNRIVKDFSKYASGLRIREYPDEITLSQFDAFIRY